MPCNQVSSRHKDQLQVLRVRFLLPTLLIVTWTVIWKELKDIWGIWLQFHWKNSSLKLNHFSAHGSSFNITCTDTIFKWIAGEEELLCPNSYLKHQFLTFFPSVRHSVFHLRNDFLDSHQPLIVIIKPQLDSDESSRVKKQTNHRQHCARAYW